MSFNLDKHIKALYVHAMEQSGSKRSKLITELTDKNAKLISTDIDTMLGDNHGQGRFWKPGSSHFRKGSRLREALFSSHRFNINLKNCSEVLNNKLNDDNYMTLTCKFDALLHRIKSLNMPPELREKTELILLELTKEFDAKLITHLSTNVNAKNKRRFIQVLVDRDSRLMTEEQYKHLYQHIGRKNINGFLQYLQKRIESSKLTPGHELLMNKYQNKFVFLVLNNPSIRITQELLSSLLNNISMIQRRCGLSSEQAAELLIIRDQLKYRYIEQLMKKFIVPKLGEYGLGDALRYVVYCLSLKKEPSVDEYNKVLESGETTTDWSELSTLEACNDLTELFILESRQAIRLSALNETQYKGNRSLYKSPKFERRHKIIIKNEDAEPVLDKFHNVRMLDQSHYYKKLSDTLNYLCQENKTLDGLNKKLTAEYSKQGDNSAAWWQRIIDKLKQFLGEHSILNQIFVPAESTAEKVSQVTSAL